MLRQKVFFIATATEKGPINLSSRGHDCFRIINPNQVAWIDYYGSNNETAQHLFDDGRITVMFCDLESNKNTIRLFGVAQALLRDFIDYKPLLVNMGLSDSAKIRQIILMNVDFTSTSCGSGVPIYSFEKEGDLYEKWDAAEKGGRLTGVVKAITNSPRPCEIEKNLNLIDDLDD